MASKKISKLQSIGRKVDSESEASSDESDNESKEQKIEYKTDELVIERKTQHEQVLHRPDMWVGGVKRIKSSGRIWVKDRDKFKCKEVMYSEALLRLFIEAMCNSIDNIWRSKQFKIPAKVIRITIDRETGYFTVWNDGKPIPLGKFIEKNGTITDDYIPEVIFGQLLTSSNYDDNEKRKTSGRNGVGCKCLLKTTILPLWNGSFTQVQNIKIGDQLIGQDGTPRNVISISEGYGTMYDVKQFSGETYTVNSNHTLSLKMPDHRVIFWNSSKGGWNILWWDDKTQKVKARLFGCPEYQKIGNKCDECDTILHSDIPRHYRRKHPGITPQILRKSPTVDAPDTEEIKQCRIVAENFRNTIPEDNSINIDIQDYLKLPKTARSRLAGFRIECIQWPFQPVELDPYILGAWLGDGFSHGYGFAINDEADPEITNYLIEWGKTHDATLTQSKGDCYSWKFRSTTRCGRAPLKKLLEKYDLVKNKHVPKEYIINDRNTRLEVLAGMIDTDGTVCREGSRVVIAQSIEHKPIVDGIVMIARSLGFSCQVTIKNTQWKWKGELRRGKAYNINISGELQDIPTKVLRKKCASTKSRNSHYTGQITIKQVPNAEFVGIEIDGDHRLALEDFTITHNCCNIFSDKFDIELYNPSEEAIYRQKWSRNMFDKSPPTFDRTKSHFPKSEGKTGYTKISWHPDYKRFGMTGLDDDFMSVVEKSVYDYALIARINGVTTYYNDKELPITDLQSYVQLYYTSPPEEMIQLKSEDCTVVVAPKADPLFKGDLMQVSFMNGILTIDGGVHVDEWEEAIFRPIINKINKTKPEKKEEKKKKTIAKAKKKPERPTIDITHIRKYFSIFIVAEADNPTFKGQNKTYFNGPPIQVKVKRTDISKLMKWSFVDRIEDSIRFRELSVLKDAGKKKRNYTRVEGLDDANNAGDKKLGKDCILTLSEGDSAATYIVNGMKYGIEGKKGHDNIGIFPLRGKILNVRNASIATIVKNKEVKSIIMALGLEYGLDYTLLENRNKLRYGKLYAVADSDYDGAHIIALIYNLFHTLFPSLLEAGDFFHFLRIPIIKINTKETKLSFLFYYEAQKYLETHHPGKKAIRYFKGLGTSNKADVKEDFGRYPVSVILDDSGNELMQQVFATDDSDFRKDWLINYVPTIKSRTTEDYQIEEISITNYLNEEMICYSIDSCKRAIACILDGLKESHRKVLSAAFKKKLSYKKSSLKVAQFAGYVAEHMGYHHGEQNLYDTITKMGQRFAGSNNIPLFVDDGQFGSRRGGGNKLSPGKDAAKARYLFTRLDMLTRLIYRPEDDPYLPDKIDEGEVVEKQYYLPIVPMLLVNGSSGIGTGSSSNVPMYNVLDIIDWIETWMDKGGNVREESKGVIFYETPDLCPYYRGFIGKIEVDGSKITTYGKLEEIAKNTYRITEIPIGRLNMSIQKFKEKLEKMQEDKQLKKIKNNSPDGDIPDFTIITDDDGINPTLKNLKLVDTLSTSNMVLFDEADKLRKFKSIEDILLYYCERRYDLYKTRKEGQLDQIRQDLKWATNKVKFIRSIDSNEISILDRDEGELDQELVELKFDRKPVIRKGKVQNVDDEDEEDEKREEDDGALVKSTFDYLLDMRARSLNIQSKVFKNLEKECESLKKKIVELEAMTVEEIWKGELKELKEAYFKWVKIADANKDKEGGGKKKGRAKFKPAKKESNDADVVTE